MDHFTLGNSWQAESAAVEERENADLMLDCHLQSQPEPECRECTAYCGETSERIIHARDYRFLGEGHAWGGPLDTALPPSQEPLRHEGSWMDSHWRVIKAWCVSPTGPRAACASWWRTSGCGSVFGARTVGVPGAGIFDLKRNTLAYYGLVNKGGYRSFHKGLPVWLWFC